MTCLFRHKFEARYHTKHIMINMEDPKNSDIKIPFIEITYIHDICIKCGKIVKDENK